jgi:hypothetical protein
MENLLKKLATGTANLGEITGSGGTSKGLNKILALKGLSRLHMNYIYGIYLGERMPLIKLKGYLSNKFNIASDHKLKLVNGAVEAIASNSYRSVDCYKCGGSGVNHEVKCARCSGTGQAAKKPKEYELCGLGRSFWYKKENILLRSQYADIVDHLFQIDNDLRAAIKQNGSDTY